MTNTFPVGLGFNMAELENTQIRAADWPSALTEARRGWGKAWTHVIVTDPLTEQQIDVAWRRSDGDLTPEQWVTRKLAPPAEVPIVSIDQFLAALQPQIVGFPGPTANWPVWILLDGMLYAPERIGVDAEFGAIMIIPAAAPSATAGLANGTPE